MQLVLTLIAAEGAGTGPNPIAPETKELVLGAASFLVFFAAMRLWLFPKVKAGMQLRYDGIRADHEAAGATTDAARAEVARYEAALAEVRAESAARLDKARAKADAERQAKMSVVNARIAQQRAQADHEVADARAAARDQVASGVAAVAARMAELAVGVRPDDAVVRRAVAAVMASGGRS